MLVRTMRVFAEMLTYIKMVWSFVLLLGELMASATWLANPSLLMGLTSQAIRSPNNNTKFKTMI